jgi:hypothetical protein
MILNALRRALYVFARLLGDVNAVRRGPKAIVKHQVNKAIGRRTRRLFWR